MRIIRIRNIFVQCDKGDAMLVQSTSSSGERFGAAILVATAHLFLISLLFASRTGYVASEGEAIEVHFLAAMQSSKPALQQTIPPVAMNLEPQLFVPTPKVTVAATAPVTAPVTVSIEPRIASTSDIKDLTTPPSPPVMSDVEYVKQTATPYPPASRRLKEQGTVVLRVLVDEAGRAAQVDIHRSSGFPRLDTVACETVRNWLFKPYVREGHAQAALVYVPIEFSLRTHESNERYGRRKAPASAAIELSSGA